MTATKLRELLPLGLLSLLPACVGASSEERDPPPRFELFVLGVAQDGGVPHVGCRRACCRRARAQGLRRYPTSLGIHDSATGRLCLLEATPRIEPQLALLHELSGQERSRQPVDAVLLTHAHIGHYLGLAQFGREVASTKDLPVHLSPRFAAYLSSHGPWKQLVDLGQIRLQTFVPGRAFTLFDGLEVTPIQVPHRDEFSDTMAFRIKGPTQTILFLPDIDSFAQHEGLLERLIDGVDVAYLDATFYDGRELPNRDIREIPHPLMVDTMRRLEVAARDRPGRFRFIHLNHSNPAWQESGLVAEIEARGFRLARRGERIGL